MGRITFRRRRIAPFLMFLVVLIRRFTMGMGKFLLKAGLYAALGSLAPDICEVVASAFDGSDPTDGCG